MAQIIKGVFNLKNLVFSKIIMIILRHNFQIKKKPSAVRRGVLDESEPRK